MAGLVPARGSCLARMTGGEKRFSERLEKKLEDDYFCWYDVPVGPKQLRPDFVIVHPQRGLLVLEVKDWKLDTIRNADRVSVQLLTDRGLVTEKNPLLQARVYALELAVTLERDPQLRNRADHGHAGKLVMPWGFGVVLANISRAQFESSQLDQVIDPAKVICKDEMLEDVDDASFQLRLWGCFGTVFPCRLSLPQIDRIRWHLFPEIRVTARANQFGLFGDNSDTQAIAIPELIRVMDMNQEQLARSMGDGHRVIHGVAGSGKTMILGYRCLKLARELSKPILVLCFNVTLAGRLRQMIEAQGIAEQVSVRSFHDWCGEMLSTFNVERPAWTPHMDIYADALVQRTIEGVDRGQIPRAQYGAVMIDEGHDFRPDWLKLVAQMVDPASNAMLVLYDDAQAIYGAKETSNVRRKFSFASVGIQAQGRTTILRLNYRNTFEILCVARSFASELLIGASSSDGDDGVPLIAPESAGRRGPMPELIRVASPIDEAALIARQIEEELSHGRPPSDIAIVYRRRQRVTRIETQLTRLGIPFRTAMDQNAKRVLFDGPPSVKLVSMHSSKGLEFHSVYIPGLEHMPAPKESEISEARLLYVAMTRATDRLVMTCAEKSPFVDRLGTLTASRNLVKSAPAGR